ncbi:MAG: hypothetical protein AB8G11_09445 [Saprospiraceae bacterium]
MRILFLFVGLIFITSCQKTDLVTMVYQETGCSDAWMSYEQNNNSREEAIMDYFDKELDIKLNDVKITVVSNGPFCYACHCPTGREIEVSIDEKFVSSMESEGFTRK